jgi:Protein of unknown function (DUF4011)/REase_MTES_1575/AAA domain
MTTSVDLVTSALERWRNNLIDLTRRNPLLSLKPNHTTYLEIVQPELMKVYDPLLVQGKSWLFYFPPDKPKADKKNAAKEPVGVPPSGGSSVRLKAELQRPTELRTTEEDRAVLLKILTNLYRRAWTDYRERGLHTLHLGLGILEWRDEADEVIRSPIVLLPVKLERHSLKDPFQLTLADDDPIVNPALAARLKQDFGFQLPTPPPDWEEKKPDQYLAELRTAIAGLPGWDVQPSVVLTLFSFFKGVIFQDLQDNAERLRTHPIVRTLAGEAGHLAPGKSPGARYPIDERELDDKLDPREVYHILDADGSQRLCLEAAARGESFVLIGPPGTGKSQTIANLIADRIAHGKKVLFVSEKMAALEVVYKRLCNVGLGEFCLELHSAKANKREVIKELARCYQEKLAAQPQPSATDFALLKDRREQLNRYVQSLHQIREPMHKSVWDALAELPRWQDLPMIQIGLPTMRQAGDVTARLTLAEFAPAHLDELKQLLQRLQHHWHIRTETNYPWRGFKADRYSLQLRDEIVSLIDRVRARDEKLRAAADQYAKQLGLRGSIADLLKLGDLLEKRPPNTQASWLKVSDLNALISDFEKCAEQYARLGETRKPLTDRYGPALWKLPSGSAAKIEQAWKNSAPLLAPGDQRGTDFLKSQQKLRAWAAETQKRIPGWLVEVRALEKWLALPLPTRAGFTGAGSSVTGSSSEMKLDPSVEGLRAFVRLATLGAGDAPPDKAWLEDRNVASEAQAIIASSKDAFLHYKKSRQYLLKLYDEKLFKLDLARIGRAYAGWYQSWWCVFSWQYRKDRRAIAKTRPMEDLPSTVAADMQLAGQVQGDRIRLEAEQPQRAKLLGRYEKGLDTDIETAEKAVRHALEAHDLLGQVDCERFPTKAIDALIATSTPEKIRAAVKRLNESFIGWMHLTQELQAVLPMTRLPGVGTAFDECALSAIAHYAKDLQTSLNQFAGLCDPVLGASLPADMQTFVADLKQAEELLAWEASQATEAERWTKLLGPAFAGVGTDWDALRKAITWARLVRECVGRMQSEPRGLTPWLADSTPPSSRELRQALEPYEHALHSLEIRFDAPGPVLDGMPLKEHTPEVVLDLLTKWRDRVGELADWVDWRYLPERFAHLGLKSFWDHLQQHDVVREQVVDLFLKSFWSGWVDAMFQHDPVLSQYRRNEHEQLLKEFRELDRRILQQGAARITAILDPLQSKRGGDDPEVALLMKEAHKKTKHLPLRHLFDSMPGLLLQLKPCMLMSPLSVSQFLSTDASKVHFDLIVFDEASQILPEDAVAAISRGKQLVITGDNQQLPPTTFFHQNADDGADEEDVPLFESILDACLGAGMASKMLRWHYRSQHEHLIAFSNDSFYDGRLVTFPSACFQHASLGVQFKHVPEGVYDRGGKRDNPREAKVVAELVLDHYQKTPDKTLGVIAFSYAQMDAIADEIERQLRDKPDLERYFKEDRLEGFFVKNLETVQGDERDVILLSVGYGRDEHGKIELNFGPLNREGGERRLNVAVTRARQRLLVVSSIRAGDIKLGNSQAKGLAHLQRYLDFAEHGMKALEPEADGTLPLTGLHEDVMRELKKLGFDSIPFVGCGPCRLDVGVRDPKKAGRFLLGIEFDGPMHAQASTARDRDRLRPEVLARLGWKLHRLGSPDWIFRKEEEIARLRQALIHEPEA